jgi:lipopolysaccharide export system protein LptA
LNLKPLRLYFGLLFFLLSTWAWLPAAFGQRPAGRNVPPRGTSAPAIAVPAPADSAVTDSAQVAVPKGDVETTIKYFAKDSVISDVAGKVMHLYGDASIEYGTISLKAAYIRIDWEASTLTAEGAADSTGRTVNRPVFQDDQEYEADRIVYNYKTKKGRVSGVVTKQQEGFMHAEVIKKNDKNEIFGLHARYTTCDLAHPHFYISAGKMKAIPKDRIISGPFNMVFADIPTPFGLPFGFFPSPNKRASGLIMPTFGETQERGFFLRNMGYYLALNDYIGLRFTGDVYSFGGYAGRADGNYIKRYAYSGSFGLDYSFIPGTNLEGRSLSTGSQRGGSQNDRHDFRVRWSHRPVPRNGKSFAASVNAGSFFYNQRNSYVASELLAPSFNSNISYQVSKPNSPFNYTVSLQQSQNSQSQTMSFTLPDVTFGMARQNPFQWFTKGEGGSRFLNDIGISYLFNARNYITNDVASRRNIASPPGERRTLPINAETLPVLLKNAQIGARHSIPITLSSFRVLKYLQFSPSVSYNENWYLQRNNYTWDSVAQKVQVDTIRKFSRVYDYSASASLTTAIYGTAYIKGKKVEAIRHIIRPSISYNWRPDFGKAAFDFYQTVYDVSGREQLRSRYEGSLYGAPGFGRSSVFSFSVNNNVEMKVKAKQDSTGSKAFEKISLIDNFTFTSGYNVAADSFRLQPINVNFSTMLFNKVNVSANGLFDPYQVNDRGRRLKDTYYFNIRKLQFARMVSANINANFELNPKARTKPTTAPNTNLQHLTNHPVEVEYLDFDIPWTLSVQTSANFFPATFPNQQSQTVATVGVNGSLGITEKWKVSYSSGYDFINNTVTYSNINIHRDLHCWEMSFSWVPFGLYQMYSFNINAKASLLKDLKYNRNRQVNEFR